MQRRNRRLLSLLTAAALALLLLTACNRAADPQTLRLAVLPILDNLPMYVADEQGFFAEEGLTVEFIPVGSAAERDQVIQAGQADGMINELLSTQLYNDPEIQVVVVSYSRVATPEYPQYRVLAAGPSGITTPEQLAGQDIGISEGTIIEYATDRLLEAAGLAPEEIQTIAVPGIADRMSLLASGELPAATLPDPLASLAIQNGAVVVIDDTSHPEFGHSTYAFRQSFVDENPRVIEGFLRAVGRGVEAINADKEAFSDLLVERQLVPQPLIGSYTVPDFPEPSVPPQSVWDDVLAWAQAKGYVQGSPDYADSVSDAFLP